LIRVAEVSALEWKGSLDRVAATSSEGIGLNDLRMSRPEIDFYPTFGYSLPATNLQCYDNILATAGRDCVRLWDVRYVNDREPLQELRHKSVNGLEFSPKQRNVLATGGANGIPRLWNFQSGSLQDFIALLPQIL
jgi:WD40 repeat protein